MKWLKVLCVVGALLAMVGSFLPWWCEGDFIWYCTKGVRISWGMGSGPVIDDNGGMLVLILAIIVVLLIIWPPGIVKDPITLAIVCESGLVAISMYHIGRLVIRRIMMGGMIGAPEVKLGLVMVMLGSLILVVTGWCQRQKSAT